MGTGKVRVWRTAAEKRRIVELTFQPGMSVAQVAQSEGVNSHQVFQWRKAYREGGLGAAAIGSSTLLPVIVAENSELTAQRCGDAEASGSSGSIHIEFPGRATITAEHGADTALLRVTLEALRQ